MTNRDNQRRGMVVGVDWRQVKGNVNGKWNEKVEGEEVDWGNWEKGWGVDSAKTGVGWTIRGCFAGSGEWDRV
jgi:hypothetical protein